jgi:hypothetical protein
MANPPEHDFSRQIAIQLCHELHQIPQQALEQIFAEVGHRVNYLHLFLPVFVEDGLVKFAFFTQGPDCIPAGISNAKFAAFPYSVATKISCQPESVWHYFDARS